MNLSLSAIIIAGLRIMGTEPDHYHRKSTFENNPVYNKWDVGEGDTL